MHLADGVIDSLPLIAGLGALSALALGRALRQSVDSDPGSLAWSGTLGAFVLAAQAVNVPVLFGASAHVVGASLVTLCLGPARALVTLAAVLVLQALLLADGGVVALGINFLTLALVPVLSVELVRRLVGRTRRGLVAVLGTFVGHVLSASTLASLLVLGAGTPVAATFGWLLGVQALAGLAEGGLTALAMRRLGRGAAPDPLDAGPAPEEDRWANLGWPALATALVVALLPFASTQPDALERLLEHLPGSLP